MHVSPDGKILAQRSLRIKSEVCNVCGHSYQSHLHLKYRTEEIEIGIRDEASYKRITTKEEAKYEQDEKLKQLTERIKELKKESRIISKISARFAYFLKNNAILAFNDTFEQYIKYLIQKDDCMDGNNAKVENLKKMLDHYNEEKKIIENAISSNNDNGNLNNSPDFIDQSIQELFKLKHNGKTIERLFRMQKDYEETLHRNNQEVMHQFVMNVSEDTKNNLWHKILSYCYNE